jgi:hypothetical protein
MRLNRLKIHIGVLGAFEFNANEILYLIVSNDLFCVWKKLDEKIVKINICDSRKTGEFVNFAESIIDLRKTAKNQILKVSFLMI